MIFVSFVCRPLLMAICQNLWCHTRTTFHWLCTHIFIFFNFLWISLAQLRKFYLKCTHIYPFSNISENESKWTMLSHEKWHFVKFCCTVPMGVVRLWHHRFGKDLTKRAATKILIKTLKNHNYWLDYQNLFKLLLLGI